MFRAKRTEVRHLSIYPLPVIAWFYKIRYVQV